MSKNKNKTPQQRFGTGLLILFIATVLIVGIYRFTPLVEEFVEPKTETVQGVINAHFIDVGQGDASLVQIPKEDGTYFNMLIDSGEYSEADSLIDYLESSEVEKLDAIVASHPHADHIGAMSEVIEKYEVEDIYMPDVPDELTPTTKSYESMLDAIIEKQVPVTYVEAGDTIETQTDAKVEVLSPNLDMDYDDLNNLSIVMKISLGEQSFLFTGDAEKEAIDLMIESGMNLSADVLKVPHHGSVTSTYEKMLEEINPKVAVISYGEDNSYGHPHDEVMDYLTAFGCEIRETAKEGNIIIN